MLTLWIVTVMFVGGPYGHTPQPKSGVRLTAGHHLARTGAGGRAVLRVRTGTYSLTVAKCGRVGPIDVHGEVTRTRVRCTIS
jgi:hypothetical protein